MAEHSGRTSVTAQDRGSRPICILPRVRPARRRAGINGARACVAAMTMPGATRDDTPTPMRPEPTTDRAAFAAHLSTNALVVATAIVYFAGAKLGLSMAFVAEQVTA